MNRIAASISRVRVKFDALTTEEQLALDATMAVAFDEHFQYQQLQAQAHVSGRLTPAEAQVIYIALGEVGTDENGGWAEATDTPTKVVVTMVMGELLQAQIAGRRVTA